ncbi:hypothetical protein ACVW0J_002868 [Bradyrhizobium sp. i1.7.7]
MAISAGSSIANAETVMTPKSAAATQSLFINTPPSQITAERNALVRSSRGAPNTSEARPCSTIAPWSM